MFETKKQNNEKSVSKTENGGLILTHNTVFSKKLRENFRENTPPQLPFSPQPEKEKTTFFATHYTTFLCISGGKSGGKGGAKERNEFLFRATQKHQKQTSFQDFKTENLAKNGQSSCCLNDNAKTAHLNNKKQLLPKQTLVPFRFFVERKEEKQFFAGKTQKPRPKDPKTQAAPAKAQEQKPKKSVEEQQQQIWGVYNFYKKGFFLKKQQKTLPKQQAGNGGEFFFEREEKLREEGKNGKRQEEREKKEGKASTDAEGSSEKEKRKNAFPYPLSLSPLCHLYETPPGGQHPMWRRKRAGTKVANPEAHGGVQKRCVQAYSNSATRTPLSSVQVVREKPPTTTKQQSATVTTVENQNSSV